MRFITLDEAYHFSFLKHKQYHWEIRYNKSFKKHVWDDMYMTYRQTLGIV